jgi:hypothetical protein
MITKRIVCAVAGLLIWAVSAAEAMPLAFNFTQSGFSEGAVITGTFVGEDLDMDGQLSSFDGEIISISMAFSGNSLIPAFNLDSSGSLSDLVYDLDNGLLGDDPAEGIQIFNLAFSYQAGAGPLASCLDPGVCGEVGAIEVSPDTTLALVTVTPTAASEPATALCIAAGFLGLVWNHRRKAYA